MGPEQDTGKGKVCGQTEQETKDAAREIPQPQSSY